MFLEIDEKSKEFKTLEFEHSEDIRKVGKVSLEVNENFLSLSTDIRLVNKFKNNVVKREQITALLSMSEAHKIKDFLNKYLGDTDTNKERKLVKIKRPSCNCSKGKNNCQKSDFLNKTLNNGYLDILSSDGKLIGIACVDKELLGSVKKWKIRSYSFVKKNRELGEPYFTINSPDGSFIGVAHMKKEFSNFIEKQKTVYCFFGHNLELIIIP